VRARGRGHPVVPRRARFWTCAVTALLTAVGALVPVAAASAEPGIPQPEARVVAKPEVKPLLSGLLDREGPPPAGDTDLIRDYVLNVAWADLQPRASGPLHLAGLEAALGYARQHGARVKLRIMAGIGAPDWAKHLGGRPYYALESASGEGGLVPRFWTRGFGRAYADLHARLAAHYDADPTVAEVTMSRCTTIFAEPFARQAWEWATVRAMLDAGYTAAADMACLRDQVTAHRVWRRTRSGLAVNPAQLVTPTGEVRVDDAFTAIMMRFCRDQLGPRCVLANNSIRSPISSLDRSEPHYARMYDAMRNVGGPHSFQTAAPARIGDCGNTLVWAVEARAAYVELPGDLAAAGCGDAELRTARARLR